jgi:hypothetical protein
MKGTKSPGKTKVLSMRITWEELADLEEHMERTQKSVSDILRDALRMLKDTSS